MKITMLKSRPAPGGVEACYLAGCTYTLATDGEIAMAKAFIEEGAAVAENEPAEGVAALAEAGGVPVAEAEQAVNDTLKGFKPKRSE